MQQMLMSACCMPALVQGLVSQGENLGFYPERGDFYPEEGGDLTWVLMGDFWPLQGGQTMR